MSDNADTRAQQAALSTSNTDRLARHLRPGSLAAALLEVWKSGEREGLQQKLLNALSDHHTPKGVANAPASED